MVMAMAQGDTLSFVYSETFDYGVIIQYAAIYFQSVCKRHNCGLFTDELLTIHYSIMLTYSDPQTHECLIT